MNRWGALRSFFFGVIYFGDSFLLAYMSCQLLTYLLFLFVVFIFFGFGFGVG